MEETVRRVGVSIDQNRKCRAAMEDAHVILRRDKGDAFFGVFDGHGGKRAVDFVQHCLPRVFFEQLTVSVNPSVAFENAYRIVDKALEEKGVARVEGTTAVTAYVTSTDVWVANCGDSRAVLVNPMTRQVKRLSHDHKGTDHYEVERVKGAGGTIQGGRVSGTLAVTRAFGDFEDMLGKSKGVVIVQPTTTYHPIENAGDFLVLVSDGVTDVMTDQQIAEKVVAGGGDAMDISTTIMTEALNSGSMDNITVVAVRL